MGTSSVKEMGASVETPYAAVRAAKAVVPNITSAPSKKPFMGVPMKAKSSSIVGRSIEIGLGSSWKMKVTRKNEEQRKP